MNTYKGLKVPEVRESQSFERQNSYCKRGFPSCRNLSNCKDCLFDPRNLKTFEQWEKENEGDNNEEHF